MQIVKHNPISISALKPYADLINAYRELDGDVDSQTIIIPIAETDHAIVDGFYTDVWNKGKCFEFSFYSLKESEMIIIDDFDKNKQRDDRFIIRMTFSHRMNMEYLEKYTTFFRALKLREPYLYISGADVLSISSYILDRIGFRIDVACAQENIEMVCLELISFVIALYANEE